MHDPDPFQSPECGRGRSKRWPSHTSPSKIDKNVNVVYLTVGAGLLIWETLLYPQIMGGQKKWQTTESIKKFGHRLHGFKFQLTYWWCDLRQITYPFYASDYSSLKWKYHVEFLKILHILIHIKVLRRGWHMANTL